MGIQSFITRKLKQTAVYWGSPQEDGYGGKTYDDPIEIRCRWEDSVQVVSASNGEEIISRAVVFTDTDLEENGLLYLGTMEDLISSSGESSGEVLIDSLSDELQKQIHLIRRPDKAPSLNIPTEFLRVVYLTPYISWE